MNKNNTCRRKKVLIDSQLQTKVAFRVAVYGMASMIFVLMANSFWQTFVAQGGSFTRNVISAATDNLPFFCFMALFIPFAIYDSLCLTHRFAGPIFRLTIDLQRYKTDKSVRIKFRDGDLLQDLASSVNDLMDEIADLKEQLHQQEENQAEDVLV